MLGAGAGKIVSPIPLTYPSQKLSVTCNMPLLSLPTELKLDILDKLGPSFFREDAGRLALCKQWYTLAHPVLYRDVYLNKRGLEAFLNSPGKETRLQLLKDNLRTLEIHPVGSLPEFVDYPDDEYNRHRVFISSGSSCRGVCQYTADLARKHDKQLRELADILEECRSLTELYYKGVKIREAGIESFYKRTMCRFISAPKLEVIELDIAATFLIEHDKPDADSHLCATIRRLLTSPTLRRLHLRMNDLCIGVFAPFDDAPFIFINDLVLDFCGGDAYMFGAPNPCMSFFGRPTPHAGRNEGDVKDELADLVRLMTSPKNVKVLSFAGQNEISSFDILTGETTPIPFQPTAEHWIR